mmetsp:Transcript_22365/g.26943  ORF Transcript_22365/g.26943 Transcript_22365/m.26943 type:complete len:668 (+) Transcript_22365:178-2181(+)|eukprot:CAMPEP_0197849474 /NCGR_PEP_ID=MMETSP1438-20131217/12242_1 /TAXON_ID=1461541 /ORGANISM="Pterosperma sp., Strain CCMP1384" /LENGTH=667 /DNA_ID=CAMNT_0043462183 /DNA_START=177 /DNA_END=2180 /DNA_ORIENTATION=+
MPAKKKVGVAGKGGKKGQPTPEPEDDMDMGEAAPAPAAAAFDFEPPAREVVVPKEQLQLSDEALEEEITKMLTANNPTAATNIARFSFKERTYKFEPMVDQMMMHYQSEGYVLHRSSDDAKRQLDLEKLEAEAQAEFEKALAAPKDDDAVANPDESKALRNQFNFSERAAQTQNNPARDRSTSTEPPPTASFNASCTQWEIYDAYMEDMERQRQQKEVQKNKGKEKDKKDKDLPVEKKEKESVMHGVAMYRLVKIMERMVNQNSYSDIADDFKYWEDASDQYREGEGTLLPLWKLYNERAKRKHVTSICWNPEYDDLFAVGYGSFDFMKQSSGLICCYSLKNPSHPEYTFTTESGVMCLDFHPQFSSLLAVGLYDGTVMVFDVRNKVNRPIFASSVKTGKHTDPVWQVSWQEEDLSKALSFLSVSSDGRVTMWIMSKSELTYQDVMELKLVGGGPDEGPANDEEDTLGSLAGGCSFDFNKTSDHLFVVGTEEGKIHKCSKAYNSQYLETYHGHNMAVYTVQWNHCHPKVFLSASADWTVKLWDHTVPKPVISFDLNNSIGDVAWAPYSSTVFAAVTSDGKVHVFDLSENKHEPMCEQKIVRKAKLTKVAFNKKHPIILVGDDRGCVTSLKLSPNLRKGWSAGGATPSADAEQEKLNKIMEVALKGEV